MGNTFVKSLTRSPKATTAMLGIILLSSQPMADGASFYPIDVTSATPENVLLTGQTAVVTDISPDGSIVGGYLIRPGTIYDCASLRCTIPFTWSPTNGTDVSFGQSIELPTDTEYTFSVGVEEVVGISTGGTHVLTNASRGYHNEPIMFTSSGSQLLRDPSSRSVALFASGISSLGETIVGSQRDSQLGWQAFRWSTDNGVVPIGNIPGGATESYATDVSGDGRTVVGYGYAPDVHNSGVAFRWTDDAGVQELGKLPGVRSTPLPSAVSYDGSVIVGQSITSDSTSRRTEQAFRWTDEGIEGLGQLAGFRFSSATDVSGDGHTVIGNVLPEGRPDWLGMSGFWTTDSVVQRAFIWDGVHGMQNLQSVLMERYGLATALASWTIFSASAISDDGRVIAGLGRNADGEFQGWYAVIPEPPSVMMAYIVFSAFLIRARRRAM